MACKLDNKEASLFRQVVRHYESKQYKKGLKSCEQILRKVPNHGETLAMKALIINSRGESEEAFGLAKLALQQDMKSHVCWHVYGLLYRSVKNYEEAIKAYRMALRYEPESQQILRDLALLQIQMRDYSGYCESRIAILTARPQLRQNWTALAVAYHLCGKLRSAENVLTRYEETLKPMPPMTDLEHAEATLYKNTVIAETGRIQQAYDHLEAYCKGNLNGLTVLELRARYLNELSKPDEASAVYKALLDRNPERRDYFKGLEQTLTRINESLVERTSFYENFARAHPRGDAARRIPLDFLRGEAFECAADLYLREKLGKGVASTFANVRALYRDVQKRDTILHLVRGYVDPDSHQASNLGALTGSESNGQAGDSYTSRQEMASGDKEQLYLSSLHFLAQHYNDPQSQRLTEALEYADRALAGKSTMIEFLMTKARILKHMGDLRAASELMEEARLLDKRDRYINTKATKYQLRSDQNDRALKTMSAFTRIEATGGPLGDLHDMQCLWFLIEDAESYLRQERLGFALRRLTSVFDIFSVWEEDQFDFHTFSLRKGMIRAYVELVSWETHLRRHPFYARAAVGASKCYVKLHDEPELAQGFRTSAELTNALGHMSLAEQKRAAKKSRTDQRKIDRAEARDREEHNSKKSTKDDESKKDTDPTGKRLLETTRPLEAALDRLNPVLELDSTCVAAQHEGFEVFYRMTRILPALRCIERAGQGDPNHPRSQEQMARFSSWWSAASETAPQRIRDLVERTLPMKSRDNDISGRNEVSRMTALA